MTLQNKMYMSGRLYLRGLVIHIFYSEIDSYLRKQTIARFSRDITVLKLKAWALLMFQGFAARCLILGDIHSDLNLSLLARE